MIGDEEEAERLWQPATTASGAAVRVAPRSLWHDLRAYTLSERRINGITSGNGVNGDAAKDVDENKYGKFWRQHLYC